MSLLPLCSGVGVRMDVQPAPCGLAGAASGFEDSEIPIPFPHVSLAPAINLLLSHPEIPLLPSRLCIPVLFFKADGEAASALIVSAAVFSIIFQMPCVLGGKKKSPKLCFVIFLFSSL